MQTDLIQNTRVFQEFERSFNHFFDECERGFTNELIINMFCRIFQQNRVVISYKSNVKEMFFIRQGIVQVFNNDNDEIHKDKTILYLPKYSYFGDYQILCKLKSNLVFRTLSKEHAKTASAGSASPGPMAYSLPGSTGVQHATAANGRKTAPSWKMPTAPRFAADKPNKKRLNVTPGPGSYCV